MKNELSKLAAAAAVPPCDTQSQILNSVHSAPRNTKRFNSSEVDVSVSEKDMEDYRKGKLLASDPMADYVDADDISSAKKQRKSQ
jgi:hypothetical protein